MPARDVRRVRARHPLVAGLLALPAASLGAQPPSTSGGAPAPDTATVGARVQARIVGAAADAPVRALGRRCEGTVARLAGDTLVLAPGGACPAGAYLADVRVQRGHRGSRLGHAGLGLVGGIVVGGVVARVAAGDGCRVAGCDGDYAVAVTTLGGVLLGGGLGTLIGAVLPAGPQWAPLGAQPLRVAGLSLRPGVRVVVGRPVRR